MNVMRDRTVKLSKKDLLRKLQENRENHIKEYAQAVIDYHIEAKKQLEEQLKRVENKELDIDLDLTSPQNQTEFYDKAIAMFNWEVEELVELSKNEFEVYVLDEDPTIKHAKMMNTMYSNAR